MSVLSPARGGVASRWRDLATGDVLVCVAVKPCEDRRLPPMILPVYPGCEPHPLDWCGEAAFLRLYEVAG